MTSILDPDSGDDNLVEWEDRVLAILDDDEDLLVSWRKALLEDYIYGKTPQEAADNVMDLESGVLDLYQYGRW